MTRQKKVIQINVSANWGSTGRIAEGIGIAAQKAGFESFVAWGRYTNPSQSQLIRIGGKLDYLEHGIESRFLDNHGMASRSATKHLIQQIDKIRPNIIHLHNIHGYFLNYPILFDYLKRSDVPVVWTLHDCWTFTGHCAHYMLCGCDRWQTGCYDCPQKTTYPSSYLFDRSAENYLRKKEYFTSLKNLTLIPVSRWLDQELARSFLKDCRRQTIYNGIDLNAFTPSPDIAGIRNRLHIRENQTMLLGVASVWNDRKGLNDFISLSQKLSENQKIVLVGLSPKQIKGLPESIIGITRTQSIRELADFYSAADLFLNLTYEDNYPTTNLESIACGTPCLTYRTGGSPESITPATGFVTGQGDLNAVYAAIAEVKKNGKSFYTKQCRDHALAHFSREDRFAEYINLYQGLAEHQ